MSVEKRYNKLIRDNIPKIMKEKEVKYEIHIAENRQVATIRVKSSHMKNITNKNN